MIDADELNAYLEWLAENKGKTRNVSPEAYLYDLAVQKLLDELVLAEKLEQFTPALQDAASSVLYLRGVLNA